MSNIGENIKRIRKEKGYFQKQLAEKLGTTPQNLAQYENGKRIPKIETLIKIADALDCEVSDIDKNIIVHRHTVRLELSPEDIERFRQSAEAETLIQKKASGESITTDEQKKIDDYIERIRNSFTQLPKHTKELKNKIDTIGENILLADYRELNTEGQSEARKRVNELTEIPRYTKPNEPPQD